MMRGPFFVSAVIAAVILFAAIKIVVGQPVGGQAPQPPLDPAFLAKAVNALQQQRNMAFDNAASNEARAAMLAEENAKLKSELEAMKAKAKTEEKKD